MQASFQEMQMPTVLYDDDVRLESRYKLQEHKEFYVEILMFLTKKMHLFKWLNRGVSPY
jgi:hypothetical protein